MINNSFKQAGGALLNTLMLSIFTAGVGVYYQTAETNTGQSEEIALDIASDIEQIQAAAMRCYYKKRDWCNETEITAYYSGDFKSALGTNYTLSTDASGNQVLSLQTVSDRVADAAKSMVVNGNATSSMLSSSLPPPEDNLLFSNVLTRYENELQAEAMQLETEIGFGGNKLGSANNIVSEKATVKHLIAENLKVTKVIVSESLEMTQNSISDTGNGLSVNANNIELVGTTSLNGGMNLNGNDVTDIKNLESESGTFSSVTTDDLTAESGTATQANITEGTFTALSGTTLTAETAGGEDLKFTNATGTNLNTLSAVSSDTIADNLTVNTGTVSEISGNEVIYSEGVISSISGSTLNMTAATMNAANFTKLISDSVIGNSILADTGATKNTTADEVNGDTANFTVLNSDKVTGTNVKAVKASADSASVSGAATAKKLNAATFTTTNLTTRTTKATTSSIGAAEATDMSVTNTLSGEDFTGTTFKVTDLISSISVDTGTFTTLTGTNTNSTNASFGTSLDASKFTGGAFSGTDFTTGTSSVNNNYAMLNKYGGAIDNCISTTKYCIPETPTVNLNCSSCNASASRSNFSGTVTASISSCRQGCNYNWVTSGTNIIFSGCSSGTISKGGTGNPTCDVSATLAPQETATGNITIQVINAHYSSNAASDSVAVLYKNKAAALKVEDEVTLVCTNCNVSSTCSNYKCTTSSTASAYVQVSPKLSGVVITPNVELPVCDAKDPGIGSSSGQSSASVNKVSLTATIFDGDASSSGHIDCDANFTFTVTASNASGTAVLRGAMAAAADSEGGF